MFLFKPKKQSDTKKDTQPKADPLLEEKVKDNECGADDDCPMCHIPQEVVDQLKKDKKEDREN